ncbi:hypothetical protein [Salibacterium sp. K-3]
MMKHFKNKRYWILMPPFFIVTASILLFLPGKYSDYAMVTIIAYSMTLTIWNYAAKRKEQK